MKCKRGIGMGLVIAGIFIIVLQPFSMTGAVIDVSTSISRVWFFVGFGLLIAGVFMFQFGRGEHGLPRIIRSPKFIKAVKRGNRKIIENAIEKIGTGLGGVHGLTGRRDSVIKTSKGGRIHYQAHGGVVTLIDYNPSHDYKRH